MEHVLENLEPPKSKNLSVWPNRLYYISMKTNILCMASSYITEVPED